MKSLLLSALLLLSSAPVFAETKETLDFTPRFAGDPTNFSRLYFNGPGGEKYTVSSPPGVEVTGARGEVTFRFTHLRATTVILKLSPHSPEKFFDEDNLPAYRQSAAALAPPGVETPSRQEEQENPLAGDSWTSYRITSTYNLPGNSIRQSVTFLNLTRTQQIIIIVTAFEKEFKDAAQRGDALLRSWRSISEGELAIPGVN